MVGNAIWPSFEELAANYKNTAENNDTLYRELTNLTCADPILSSHRSHIEKHELGFGAPAFHSMWLRLFDIACRRFGSVRALEIGVFKGQVISLWALIHKLWKMDIRISALTPLSGNPAPKCKIFNRIRSHFDHSFREQMANGNFYENLDYFKIICELFRHLNLDINEICFFKGYSTDRDILKRIADLTFHVVYVDGDHTLRGSLHDFTTFGPKVVKGGWLVADDAGVYLPGTTFWKGHEAVSKAALVLDELGFHNILNVGHNRIYERIA